MPRRTMMLRHADRLTLRTKLVLPAAIARSTPIIGTTNRLHASPGNRLRLIHGSIVPLDNNRSHTYIVQIKPCQRKLAGLSDYS